MDGAECKITGYQKLDCIVMQALLFLCASQLRLLSISSTSSYTYLFYSPMIFRTLLIAYSKTISLGKTVWNVPSSYQFLLRSYSFTMVTYLLRSTKPK